MSYTFIFQPALVPNDVAKLKNIKGFKYDCKLDQALQSPTKTTLRDLSPGDVGLILNALFISPVGSNSMFGNKKTITTPYTIHFHKTTGSPACVVDFKWDNIRHLENEPGLVLALNQFRNMYIRQIRKYITDSSCTSQKNKVCELIPTGSFDSEQNVGPQSDFDINVVFKMKFLDASKSKQPDVLLNTVTSIFKSIDAYHNSRFTDTILSMFDANFYADIFDIDADPTEKEKFKDNFAKLFEKCYDSCKFQHGWAVKRAKDVINEFNKTQGKADAIRIPNFLTKDDYVGELPDNINNYKPDIGKYSEDASRLIRNVSEPIIAQVASASDLIEPTCKSKDFFNKYSSFRYQEEETYRSVGAYLHNVAGMTDLPPFMLVDAVLDNWGFMLNNLFVDVKVQGCDKEDLVVIDFNFNVFRVAKYVERMCVALLLLLSDVNVNKKARYGILHIKIISKALNDFRKSKDFNYRSNDAVFLVILFYNALTGKDYNDNKPNEWYDAIVKKTITPVEPFMNKCDVRATNPRGGGKASQTFKVINILGRKRKMTRTGRSWILHYFGGNITLTQARLIEKMKMKHKKQI